MADHHQKTEPPTPRRIRKAREDGQFPSARHFVSSMQMVLFMALLSAGGAGWLLELRRNTAQTFARAFSGQMSAAELAQFCADLGWRSFAPLLKMGAALVIFTLAVQLAATRFGVSLKRVMPDLKRLNPISKLREMRRQNLVAFLQALILLPVFGGAVYYTARDNFPAFVSLPLAGIGTGMRQVAVSVEGLLWKGSLVFLGVGVVDLVRQQRRYQKDLRMSKQEIRDEVKELEGNPQIKMRIRRLRRDLLRRHMMQEVPKATALVVNPTHYAVAIRYEMKLMPAPVVVAKGRNYLALRIRQKAVEHQVPLIENPPLAQALYKSVAVGQEIPAQFYRAVAEILAYIYRLTQGRAPARG